MRQWARACIFSAVAHRWNLSARGPRKNELTLFGLPLLCMLAGSVQSTRHRGNGRQSRMQLQLRSDCDARDLQRLTADRRLRMLCVLQLDGRYSGSERVS